MKKFDNLALKEGLAALALDANATLIVTCGNNSPDHVFTGLRVRVENGITGTYVAHEDEPGATEWFNALQKGNKTYMTARRIVDAFIAQHELIKWYPSMHVEPNRPRRAHAIKEFSRGPVCGLGVDIGAGFATAQEMGCQPCLTCTRMLKSQGHML